MEKMGLNEIRSKFLEFFESKGHYVANSYSLVPNNDKSLLLINSGMAPLKNYFSGVEVPPSVRMCTSQKCIRTGDIENVGITARHATFFEMMGNFSFGDYFKRESIKWGWEFVTEWLNIPEDKIWVTVYEEDDDSYDIWAKEMNFPEERMVRLGKDDNFWEIGTGPCGPCSEIYFDRGEEYGCDNPDCKPGCDCDRYLEFWNHVFTQFDRDEEGNYSLLENKNIDTGMGLERMGCIMQGVDTIFEVDTIKSILEAVEKLTGVKYGENPKNDISIRIITDHIRAVTFLVSDGVLPSNEGRGYVLRRLLRRAARHGKLLGVKELFLQKLIDEVIKVNDKAYPVLVEKESYIKKVVGIEEEKFNETIDQGTEILNSYIEVLKNEGKTVLSGQEAFKLYDTYGFPIDLTKEILEEEHLSVDEEAFNEEMEKQKERARNARGNMDGESWKEDPLSKLESTVDSTFNGYSEIYGEGTIEAIVKDDELVQSAEEGDKVSIVLDNTTFYPEGGGQVGDCGLITNENLVLEVLNTKKGANNSIKHIGIIKSGRISNGDKVKTLVDRETRMSAARNHSATHLLHKALREVLGEHVNQAGSLVTPERLRFDITHFEAISNEELKVIEEKVNNVILSSLDIKCDIMNIKEAKEKGATALFGEKYGDEVRVVSMGDYSTELCGGTHLTNTSQVGMFKILSEGGVAAGVRRIEAITGKAVYEYLKERDGIISEVCVNLKSKEDNLIQRISSLLEENKNLSKELHDMKAKMSLQSVDSIFDSKVEVNGVNLITNKFEGMDMDTLRETADNLRDKLGSGVVVLANVVDDKVNFVVTATKDVLDKGIHSGNIVREVAKIAGGKGGGRPNMAQAGASDVSKVDQALSYASEVIKTQVK
ncbi:TPA: alanine--tRNA ligase [Clostridioides difficile]|uniref:Alanine--tRNA ligase n=16 Tax=Clostridioides difficile TaxID=1496 RepID=SYA_CLOD6|nr:alanine--tRNA ligase [Clostridioides difficile]Q18BE7.1 RecName: Full=Alanine--tRNA ligase; AltName: Full=Alanyl-tRNA synthetase; Short=AlaRS [Clostridioides difficile 630]EQG61622.1 alanine--tRNA ligase [Clostridioides difficile DA00149]EQK92822.1 alanine--tRNA ligase [Clostridioides difficile CD127]OFU00688.1 alanine--tRNA ligase [Clostridium sp. HMSC19D07]OFU04175.1 alanine--tRNA ligase [Clostridium sp. HMSC19E03]OFU06282.1 alanine--tRNA ligase [Clostridium sp. HMSC19D02]OFU06529.1 ala